MTGTPLQVQHFAVRPWLVGESNPYGSDPRYALYPDPPGCAGWRLCHKVFGLTPKRYIGAFERRNLLEGGRWSVPRAREAAMRIAQESSDAPLVLLGARVAAAFDLPFRPFWVAMDGLVAVLPHPSGLSRAWNDPAAPARARTTVESLLAQWEASQAPASP